MRALLVALLAGACWTSMAPAGEILLEGLVFSDELGGMRLLEGRGRGSLEDPFVLVEEIVERGPAVLVIRGLDHRFGNRIRSQHEVGFALTKIVRNATKEPWSLFNLELREFLNRESPFGDGLSFGQASDVGRPFISDSFVSHTETGEPYDGIQFADGVVEPGDSVALSFVVTDTTPRWQFYLMQKRDSPVAGRDAPPGSDRQAALR